MSDKKKLDFKEIIFQLWINRKCLIWWCTGTTVFGIIIAFSTPKTYTVTATFAPEQTSMSGLSNIASMVGLNLGDGEVIDAIDPSMFPMISESLPFLQKLAKAQVRTSTDTTLMTFEKYLKDVEKTPWYVYVKNVPNILMAQLSQKQIIPSQNGGAETPSPYFIVGKKEMRSLIAIAKNIVVSQNMKTMVITVSATFQDPMATTMMTSAIIQELQNALIEYKTKKAQADLDDLKVLEKERRNEYTIKQKEYADFVGKNRKSTNEIINVEKDRLDAEMTLAYQALQQVSTQRYLAEATLLEKKPCYAIINPPTFPLLPDGNRKIIIIMWLLLGLGISSFWILYGKTIYKRCKNLCSQLKEK